MGAIENPKAKPWFLPASNFTFVSICCLLFKDENFVVIVDVHLDLVVSAKAAPPLEDSDQAVLSMAASCAEFKGGMLLEFDAFFPLALGAIEDPRLHHFGLSVL